MTAQRIQKSPHSVIRWGAREEKTVAGLATVEVAQFLDLQLLAPQQLSLALYALTAAPIPGLTVRWTIGIGGGSFSHIETFTTPVSDIALQVPLLLVRPASSLQVSATITSIIPETKQVKLVALSAPTSPTWSTDIGCSMEVL